MRQAGVSSGDTLFAGVRDGNRYYGTARVFSKDCDHPLEYDVSGNVISEKHVVLHGTREIFGKGCRPTGRMTDDTLEFRYLIPEPSLAADNYATYSNARFGYSISYPRNLLYPQGESINGDGQKFISRDASASLTVYGTNNINGERIEDIYREESHGAIGDRPNKILTYKTKKENWFVVSGVDSGRIFYQKTIVYPETIKTMMFEYPDAQKAKYDAVLKIITASFKG